MDGNYSKATFTRLLAIAFNAGGSLLLFPFILHQLGEQDFGIWSLVTSITGYLLLLDMGIILTSTRHLAFHMEDKSVWTGILSNGLFIIAGVAVCLLIGSGLIFFAPGLFPVENKKLLLVVGIILIEVSFSILFGLYQSVLRAELKYFELGLYEIIRILLRITGIPLILSMGGGLLSIVVYSSAANMSFFILMVLYVYRKHGGIYFSNRMLSKRQMRELLNFGRHYALSDICDIFRYRADSMIVGYLLGLSAVAHYAIMLVIVDMMVQILMRFQSYWDTVIISHAGKENHVVALETCIKSLTIGLFIAVFGIYNTHLLGYDFIKLWVGEKYAYLHVSLVVFSFILLGYAIQVAASPFFNAYKKHYLNSRIAVIESISKLILIMPLSQEFGFNGIIMSSLFSFVLFGGGLRFYWIAKMAGIDMLLLMRKTFENIKYLLVSIGLLLGVEVVFQHIVLDKYLILCVITCQLPVIYLLLVKDSNFLRLARSG